MTSKRHIFAGPGLFYDEFISFTFFRRKYFPSHREHEQGRRIAKDICTYTLSHVQPLHTRENPIKNIVKRRKNGIRTCHKFVKGDVFNVVVPYFSPDRPRQALTMGGICGILNDVSVEKGSKKQLSEHFTPFWGPMLTLYSIFKEHHHPLADEHSIKCS